MFDILKGAAVQAKNAAVAKYETAVVATGMAMMMGSKAFAQADPTQPLKQVEDARAAARTSTMASGDIETGASNVTDIIIFLAVPLGIGIALWGGYDMWKQTKDENSRRGVGTGIAAVLIGSAVTVIAVLAAVPAEYFLGTKA